MITGKEVNEIYRQLNSRLFLLDEREEAALEDKDPLSKAQRLYRVFGERSGIEYSLKLLNLAHPEDNPATAYSKRCSETPTAWLNSRL